MLLKRPAWKNHTCCDELDSSTTWGRSIEICGYLPQGLQRPHTLPLTTPKELSMALINRLCSVPQKLTCFRNFSPHFGCFSRPNDDMQSWRTWSGMRRRSCASAGEDNTVRGTGKITLGVTVQYKGCINTVCVNVVPEMRKFLPCYLGVTVKLNNRADMRENTGEQLQNHSQHAAVRRVCRHDHFIL